MAENITEVLTGAGVLAVALGFAAYAGIAGTLHRESGSYQLHASFRSVDGVTVGTEVRMAGVKIGSVTSLTLGQDLADAAFHGKAGYRRAGRQRRADFVEGGLWAAISSRSAGRQ
ncbi:MAG: MlaD family protein [Paracoccaceae bacterium]